MRKYFFGNFRFLVSVWDFSYIHGLDFEGDSTQELIFLSLFQKCHFSLVSLVQAPEFSRQRNHSRFFFLDRSRVLLLRDVILVVVCYRYDAVYYQYILRS